jgi:hypothetical protein
MKQFKSLTDANGSSVKTYVELMQEKAADHGWLSVSLFFNPDEAEPEKAFHVISNSGEFVNILAGYLLWVKRSQSIPGPEEVNIGVVKPRE